MRDSGRREFLFGSATAAGLALTAGAAGLGGVAWAATEEAARPPSAAFLDAVVAGDLERVREASSRDPGLVHTRDGEGRSAFALALLHRHAAVAELLRERGYRPDLHESALALDWERFDALAGTTPGGVNQDHPLGGTAMHAAAIGGAGRDIWRVYRYGADPDAAPAGRAPLFAALDHPDLATAEQTAAALLSNGADPAARQPDGRTALHAAAARGSVAIVEMLVRKGAAVESLDAQGRTPLAVAEASGHAAAADRLRRHREIPRACSTSRTAYDAEGRPYTAPDLSAFFVLTREKVVGLAHRDLDALRADLARHPDLAHAVATTTEAAVEAGAHMGRIDIVDLLLERGAPYSLPTAVVRNDLARARALLEEDPARIHERGAHDFALLWYPVIGGGSLEMAELLIGRGADVEDQHWMGTTALHWAAQAGQVEMAALLLDRGADPARVGSKFDAAGATSLQLARARGNDAVVRLLEDRGARG